MLIIESFFGIMQYSVAPFVEILLIVPSCVIKRVRVTTLMTIGKLKHITNIINKENIIFVFKGEIINQNENFDFYGVQDKDGIVAVDQKNNNFVQRWINITRNVESFERSLKKCTDRNVFREVLRMRDVHQMKIESSRKKYTSHVLKFKQRNGFFDDFNGNGQCGRKIISNDIEIEKATFLERNKDILSPNCDPLPTLWEIC